jgi:DNA modification methylase
MAQRRGTSTSNFGVGRRESHDAAGFYRRFRPPEVSREESVPPPSRVPKPFVQGDARTMAEVPDGSVALVVTSPPYFAGKQYEEELERDGVPGSYLEYLQLLTDVFDECRRKLEPGGRIAVNVANLGRKPYRSLSADVIRILQDDLGLLLRGEVIWQKGEGASGSCAWGSFRSAANPVLRDITERVVIASKGRFDRARSIKQRQEEGLPYESTLMSEDFMALTLDVWSIPPESARRVGHPAPFPVELPEQLIRLFTFKDDLVLDPFMGSGSALLAAARLGRRYIGYDLEPEYVAIAERRVRQELDSAGASAGPRRIQVSIESNTEPVEEDLQGRATGAGKRAEQLAEDALLAAGFVITRRNHRIASTGVTVDFVATDAHGVVWFFDVAGTFTTYRGGLLRNETVWRSLGRAHAIRGRLTSEYRLVFLTTHLPRPASEGDAALRAAGPCAFFDAIELLSDDARDRLALYAKGDNSDAPLAGYWTLADLSRRHPPGRVPRQAPSPGDAGSGSCTHVPPG